MCIYIVIYKIYMIVLELRTRVKAFARERPGKNRKNLLKLSTKRKEKITECNILRGRKRCKQFLIFQISLYRFISFSSRRELPLHLSPKSFAQTFPRHKSPLKIRLYCRLWLLYAFHVLSLHWKCRISRGYTGKL